MKRRTFSKTLAATAAIAHPAVGMLLRSLSIDPFNMQLLRRTVGFFTERGGTIAWMIEEGAIVVVDTQFPEQANHLIAEIRMRNTSPIDYVINTHHHGDHTGGNVAFKELAQTILAHENSKANQRASAESRGNLDNVLLPDETFSKNWSKKVGTEIISIDYWGEGHTNGDALIHFENANVVHLGDLVFNRRYPYIDKGAGASISNWINILDKAIKHYDRDTIFVCGHAGEGYDAVIGKDDIVAFRGYLSNLLDYVRSQLKLGKSDEQILAAEAIPGSPEWTGNGIERSLSSAIAEIRERK